LRVLLGRAAAIAALVLGIYTLVTAIRFFTSRALLPPRAAVSGIDVSEFSVDDAITVTLRTLSTTATLQYLGNAVAMQPATIGFRVNEQALRAQLQQMVDDRGTLAEFRNRLLREPEPARPVTVTYTYDEALLLTTLSDISQRFDTQPNAATIDPATLQTTPGTPGTALNIDGARTAVLRALADGVNRSAELPLNAVTPDSAGLSALDVIVRDKLNTFGVSPVNVAGVYVKDMQSGAEYSVNGDVAFSAPGWLRLAIALEAARVSDALDAAALAPMLAGSEDPNAALARIGNGDAQAGANQVNDALRELGLVNTFVAQPYGRAIRPPVIVTPANARGDINAAPDPNAQSTPAEVGVLLEMLEQCRANTGALVLVYQDLLTPAKCGQLLAAFSAAQPQGLIAAVSPNATVIQRQSWTAGTHGAAGIVRTAGQSYVIVVALYSPAGLDWAQSSLIISEIARASYAVLTGIAPPAAAPLAQAPPP
jgi:hypothetical protein